MARLNGPWQTRVSFSPGGGFGYRPGEVLVRRDDYQAAEAVLVDLARQVGVVRKGRENPDDYDTVGSFARFNGVPDTLDAVTKLNRAGIYAQVNHILFAHSAPDGSGFQANPFYANPFYANPFYANPFYANPNPAADPSFRETGQRPSSARPALEPAPLQQVADPSPPVIAILDTGYAAGQVRDLVKPGNLEVPDLDGKGYLDPVAGHGTFIAGIIEQHVPGCEIAVYSVISPFGDGDEMVIGAKLAELAGSKRRLDLVNLSFGGYSSTGMGVLAEAIAALHYNGTVVVASAGNDGTSLPMYPAVLPYVVAVGALDHEGAPAPFTNYGPWVRACTLGVEVVSTFFTDFNGSHPSQAGDDIDEFGGWAAWSGTSFAAPRVLAALAHHMRTAKTSALEAVQHVIDGPNLERKTLLGTVVR